MHFNNASCELFGSLRRSFFGLFEKTIIEIAMKEQYKQQPSAPHNTFKAGPDQRWMLDWMGADATRCALKKKKVDVMRKAAYSNTLFVFVDSRTLMGCTDTRCTPSVPPQFGSKLPHVC